jgi:hypothetical protein
MSPVKPQPRSAPLPLDKLLQMGLANCARCAHTHEAPLGWRQFQRPVAMDNGEFRYWSTCPETGEPILLWVGRTAQPSEGAPKRQPVA